MNLLQMRRQVLFNHTPEGLIRPAMAPIFIKLKASGFGMACVFNSAIATPTVACMAA
jgi:hypothetical protein